MQNLALGRFWVWQLGQVLAVWLAPHSGQNLELAGIWALQFQQVSVEAASGRFASLVGPCEPAASAPGSYHVSVPPLDYIVCASGTGR